MKSRVWVLILFILLITIIGSYIAAFRILNINQRVGDYLSENISQSLGVHFTSFSISVLPWAIIIRDANLQLDGVPLNIEVKRIRIGFSLVTLLKNRFHSLYDIKIF